MTPTELLSFSDHRPWDIPQEEWRYYQEWNAAVFLHWKADYDSLRPLVPSALEIDLFGGKPWVSVVAFSMERIHPRGLVSFPPISDFHEVNVRTYVSMNGKAGVYFLSIEGGTYLSCVIAKALSGLPYRFSKMERSDQSFLSTNKKFGDKFEIEYRIGQQVRTKEAIDKWLTERYALFQESKHAINAFEIHHVEWPIHNLEILNCEIKYERFNHLIAGTPHITHYSTGVQVLAWDKKTMVSVPS